MTRKLRPGDLFLFGPNKVAWIGKESKETPTLVMAHFRIIGASTGASRTYNFLVDTMQEEPGATPLWDYLGNVYD